MQDPEKKLLGYQFFADAGSRGGRGRMKIARKMYLSCVSLIVLNDKRQLQKAQGFRIKDTPRYLLRKL